MFVRFLTVVFLFLTASSYAQTDTIPENTIPVDTISVDIIPADIIPASADTISANTIPGDITEVKKEKITYWTKSNKLGISLNEVAFVNWTSGGNNSFSAMTNIRFERKLEKKLLLWENVLDIKFGINAEEGRELRKTEDHFEFNSNFGYRNDSISNWYYSAKLNFSTQLTTGYRYPNTEEAISKFMAPGYAFVGVGTEYSSPTEDLTIYISPLTEKSTFVLDQALANEGAFGVNPALRDEFGNIIQKGQQVRTQFGFLVSSDFTKEIWENVGLSNKLRLYSDYLNQFGNVDIDWELNLELTVNEYIIANVGSHLKYDDDIKFKEDRNDDGELETGGPRVQFKQLLGVGLVYQF